MDIEVFLIELGYKGCSVHFMLPSTFYKMSSACCFRELKTRTKCCKITCMRASCTCLHVLHQVPHATIIALLHGIASFSTLLQAYALLLDLQLEDLHIGKSQPKAFFIHTLSLSLSIHSQQFVLLNSFSDIHMQDSHWNWSFDDLQCLPSLALARHLQAQIKRLTAEFPLVSLCFLPPPLQGAMAMSSASPLALF